MKRTFTLIFLLFVCTYISHAQFGIIKGRITDTEGLVLPGANVVIEALGLGNVSDMNGFFTIPEVPAGSHQISVSYIGFESKAEGIVVEDGKTTSIDFRLEPGIMLGEIVIGTQLQGQAKALNQQKTNPNITNVVSSDQVGRFPDQNIGDALKRIPGINVQYDQGEARFAHIRGTEPRFNSFMINGERVPSAEAEIRAVQLDLIPSDMIQTIEVNKALTPDMDADAIGGSVNLVTRAIPSELRVSATLGTGYNFLSKKPQWLGSVILGQRFAQDKLGIMFSASVQDHQLGSDNIEAEWDEDDDGTIYTNTLEVRTYEIERLRQSYSLGFDFRINPNHTLYLSGMYNRRVDWENRYRLQHDIEYDAETQSYVAEISRQDKAGSADARNARQEDQQTLNATLGGDHQLGKIRLKWHGTYAKASEERQDERYIGYKVEDVPYIPDLSDPRKPNYTVEDPMLADFSEEYEFDELTQEQGYTDEKDLNGRFDLNIPLASGKFSNSIDFGGRYRGKQKERDNTFFEYSPVDEDSFNADVLNNLVDKTKDNFLPGNYQAGHFISAEFAGGLDVENADLFESEEVFEEYAGNFTVSENIYGGYISLNQNLGEKFFVLAGLRLENTSGSYEGFVYNDEEGELVPASENTNDYLNILPGAHLKYSINPTTILRFAYTNTLSRPNYFDLVPYEQVYPEDGEISVGNPTLEPTTAMNLDLSAEKYFKSIGLISVGGFYKGIQDFIVSVTKNDYEYQGVVWNDFTQPLNGGDATIAGVEVAYQQQFTFLPGAFKGIGIYLNYTYTYSEVKNFEIEGREDEKLSLPGTPENTFNASLSYEYKNIQFRASLNMADAFRDSEGIGESSFYDRWYDNVTYLDLNASYTIKKNWKIFVEANNLTNQPLRYFQGIDERTMQVEYYNVKLTAGVKFDLNVNKN
jgi:TonB-dependent receptor